MSQIIKIDPVTRVEGHLAVKTELDSGKVAKAYVTGEMFRGFEVLLRGRTPSDAQQITQRVCGVCSVEHGVASVLAQDMAFGLKVPDNGRLMRNLMQAANYISSDISHFYLLSALDFVDVTAIMKYTGSEPMMLELREWVRSQTASGQVNAVSPFLPRYAAQYSTDLSFNLGALHHYLKALEVRMLAQRLGALFSGKLPHAATLIPGGVTETVTALHIEKAFALLDQIKVFVDTAYLPDVAAVAAAFPDYYALGHNTGGFLAYGAFPCAAGNGDLLFPPGTLLGGKFGPVDVGQISEDVGYSMFSSRSGLSPAQGHTVPAPDKEGAYSWLKAPRYGSHPMEVGPLARILTAYHSGQKPAIKGRVDAALKAAGRKVEDLNSVMGRHLARAVDCSVVLEQCSVWLNQLRPDEPSNVEFSIPEAAQGYGLTEAARGALGHWIEIRNRQISNYQLVVPTTWNASPRDDRGIPGPIEQALVGTPVADPANPIEVARVIRSFDPCLACAVH